MEKRSRLSIALFAVYLAMLTGIVIFKLPYPSFPLDGERTINLVPLLGSFDENGALLLRDVIGNIAVFIPLGIFLSMFRRGWPFRKKVIPIACLTLAFEITQYVFAIGRADITDVIGNTLGGVIGIAVYALLRKLFKEKTDRIINITALAAILCGTALMAFMVYKWFSRPLIR